MRTTTIMLTAVAIVLALPAQAAFQPVSRAYEIKTNNFTAPTTPNGGVIIRECNDCTPQALRVTNATAYLFNGQTMTLDKFKDSLLLSEADAVTLTVLHHLQSDTVLRVSASLRRMK